MRSGQAACFGVPGLRLAQLEAGPARMLYPVDFKVKAEPYLIEITPKATLPAHFFFHKGEEVGYSVCQKFFRYGKPHNPPCPSLKKGGNYKKLLLKSPFEKGGFRGI